MLNRKRLHMTCSMLAGGAAGPFTVSVTLEVEAGGPGAEAIVPGGALRGGDRLGLSILLDQQAYVYVLSVSAERSVTILFPEQGDQLAGPERPERLPTDGTGFEVTGQAGTEEIYVITCQRPLREGGRPLDRYLCPPAPAVAPRGRTRTPPEGVDPEERNPGEGGGSEHTIRLWTSDDGVAVIRFSIRSGG